ncbi:hypothetical protein RJ640_001140 [Escallonia rubra]|uniref:Peptide chain release factor domain-containing protein n=1 Tax=Escallonia rubra TaxID=112253 RepID=A0AA88RI71_9ASTE|nr:hypothetical protein RJ640_001140 [Escallonia rubra]
MFSLRKKIEDSVSRAEMLAPTALELEEERHIKQEKVIREYDLWDDLAKSNEVLVKLADSAKAVDALKDLKYKAEEVKLITELAEMDVINYGLFKQAYTASTDVSKFLDKYEMSKLLKGPYEVEGACLIIEAGAGGIYPERWAEQLKRMYTKWAGKQGFGGRIVEKCPSKHGGLKSATIEFESKYAYGYLSGERGIHRMISSHNGSALPKASLAAVDVIPLFLEAAPDLLIDDKDLKISSLSSCEEERGRTKPAVHIEHIPTGIRVQSSVQSAPVHMVVLCISGCARSAMSYFGTSNTLSTRIQCCIVYDFEDPELVFAMLFNPKRAVAILAEMKALPFACIPSYFILNAQLDGIEEKNVFSKRDMVIREFIRVDQNLVTKIFG